MPRTSRKLAITHGAQFPAQGLPGDDDAEFLEDPLAEIDDPPPHDPMNSRDRAALDDRGKGGSVRVVETRRLSRSLPVDQTRRTIGVELEHPIANDLKRHPANPGRLRPTGSLINRRQRQKPPRLWSVLALPCPTTHANSIKIGPERDSHGEPPSFATLNQTLADSEIPSPSRALRALVLPFAKSLVTRGAATEKIMSGRSAAALIKRAQTLASKGDDSMIELAEVIFDLRGLPKPPDGDRPTLDELASRIKLSRRAVCYLLKVWTAFHDLAIPRERLVEVGWTKAAVVLENSEPENVEEALVMAGTCSAKELPAALKGTLPKRKARTVQLRLTPRQYGQFEAALLANGARRPRRGKKGLSGKERALMKALGH